MTSEVQTEDIAVVMRGDVCSRIKYSTIYSPNVFRSRNAFCPWSYPRTNWVPATERVKRNFRLQFSFIWMEDYFMNKIDDWPIIIWVHTIIIGYCLFNSSHTMRSSQWNRIKYSFINLIILSFISNYLHLTSPLHTAGRRLSDVESWLPID